MVELHALGQCLIRTAVTSITPRADMCFALGAYLTRERGKRTPRRWLETFLWPGICSTDASHSLSELIHKLGRKGVPIQRDDAACVWIPREAVTLDVDTLGAQAPSVLAERDLAILPGYSPRASSAFSDWVDDWRGDMQLRVLDHVITATAHATADSDWDVAFILADKALRIDPQSETALVARARAAERLARTSRKPAKSYAPSAAARNDAAVRLRESAGNGAWKPRSASRVAPDAPLVGRDQQLAQLLAQVDGALRGEIHLAYIHGPAGLGKSRLVREVARTMRAKHGAVCVAGCDRHDKHRPFSTFTQAVPRLQALPGAAGCAPATIPCLDRITHTADGEAASSPDAGPMHVSASIRAAIIDLIEAVAEEQPLLLVVEDVQWIDAASWSLVRAIADTVRRGVLVICTSRLRWQSAAMGDTERVTVIDLPPLEHTAALEHARNCLAKLDRTADDRFVRWCIDTAAGNPYFVEELVAFWHATGEQFRSPPSLIALTDARITALRPEALRVLQAAAILGRNSTVELLQKVLEFPTHVLLAAIEELGESGLLSTDGASDGQSVAPILCRHDLIIRAATRAISAHARTLLHHAAAEALEAIASISKSTELLWDCADHWRAAGQLERSVRVTVVCARNLHEMGLFLEALRWCEIALKLVDGGATRILVLREMAQVQYASRDWEGFARTVAEIRASETSQVVCAPSHDNLELCELNAERWLHRDWVDALTVARNCVQSPAADHQHRVKAAIIALKLATNLGDTRAMDAVYRDVTVLANSPDVGPIDRLTISMIYHAVRGESVVAASNARELVDIAERSLSPWQQLGTLLDCAGVLRRSGNRAETLRLYEHAFHSAVSLACFGFAADACHRCIEMHCDSGQIRLAVAWTKRYRRLQLPATELHRQRHLKLAFSRVAVSQSKWRAAETLLASSESAPLWTDSVAMLRSSALATKLRLEIGRERPGVELRGWVTALAHLNESLRQTGAQDYETFSLYLGHRAIGDGDAASTLLKTYVDRERRDTLPLSHEIAAELLLLELRLGGEP